MLRSFVVAPFFLAALPLYSQPCEPLPALRGMEGPVVSAAALDEYRTDRDAHPNDAMYATQYARALTGTKTPDAIQQLEHALEIQPNYPPARLQLALIYSSPVFHDPAKLKANLEGLWAACPDSIEGYAYVARTDDEDFMRRSAARLRGLLEKRDDEKAVGAYRTLWMLEFKVTPLAQQDAVRERIRRDVARLRKGDASQSPVVLGALEEAYKVLGDAEGTQWVASQRPSRPEGGQRGAPEAIGRWRSEHPMKGDFQSYEEQVVKQSEEWIREWPDDPYARMERFNAMNMSRDMALEDQVKAAEEWIRVYEAHPSGPAPYLQVANFYNAKNMRYSELPGLVEKGLEALQTSPPGRPVSDLVRQPANSRLMQQGQRWSAWGTAASVYVKIKRYDDARKILKELGASLQEYRPPDGASENDKRMFGNFERQYFDGMARLAHADGHRLDEMAYLREAGLAMPFPTTMNGEPYWKVQTRQIWKELGGSDEGFEAWIATPSGGPEPPKLTSPRPAVAATAGRWTTLDKPLPEFHFADFHGKTWTVADFKGKTTLINLWATWCGPCRNELPHLQQLYDKVRDRKDIQIITFNVDDNPGLIQPFLTEHTYTFPVLPAKEYIDKMLGQWSIPRNWIVDTGGTLRSESIGFGGTGDHWVEDVLQVMEKTH